MVGTVPVLLVWLLCIGSSVGLALVYRIYPSFLIVQMDPITETTPMIPADPIWPENSSTGEIPRESKGYRVPNRKTSISRTAGTFQGSLDYQNQGISREGREFVRIEEGTADQRYPM